MVRINAMNAKQATSVSENFEGEFRAELMPYRSLSRKGFRVLMFLVGFTCLVSGLAFMAIGAWPIFVFLGLDVLLIWLAFVFNYRAAQSKELVSVKRDEVRVEMHDPRGRIVEHIFNPFWTRFEVFRHEEIGITRMQLTSRGTCLPIGSFLNPADRESFASAFSSALKAARS